MTRANVPTGIGLGLRATFLDKIAEGAADGKVAFLEISPENFMHRGGRHPARLERVVSRLPVITHGLMMSLGGTDAFDDEYFGTLRGFLDRYDPPWHSDHVCFSSHDGALLHDLLPVPFSTASAKRLAARIMEARDRLERPMAIENISWYMRLGHADQDEPEFLTEVMERADCGMLLDVNNIFVNAQNHGIDPFAWLEHIPLERVWQLHVAGHEVMYDGIVIDTHGATVRVEVHDLLKWVIERTGPKPVLLERDSNIPPLPELLAEVETLQRVYDEALTRYEAAPGSAATGTADRVATPRSQPAG